MMNNKNDQEIYYRIFKILSNDPNLTQRQMAKEMGISLGKLNYCLKELVRKGIVKIERLTLSDNKVGYMYILTPRGIEEKAKITIRFLRNKILEFEEIKKQIKEISQEVEAEKSNKQMLNNNIG